jgi:hypothetical protein
MKLKIGDIVRVKTYEELNDTDLDWDWDWPYTYSQGVKGKIRKIEEGANGRLKIFLRFNFHEMFTVNPYVDGERGDATYILEENERVSFSIDEIIFEKNLYSLELE